LPDAGGDDRGTDVAHGVVDGEHGHHVTALAVDVQVDLLVGAGALQVQQLGGERVGDARVDGRAQVEDPLGQQVRVDVHDPVAARVLGDDVGDGVGAHCADPAFSPKGRLRDGITWPNDSAMASMNPYSRASPAVYQWSWRESWKIRSIGWPESSAMRPSTVSRVWRRSLACTSTSTAEPPMPADPWCMRMRACGSA